ncbi:MAG: TonB-dependent receptor plug domain-containing protein [Prevotellaceae bacterium]|jgi:TonB-dependent SusC/RagA subfamily outer membrane receptor|nr:TonB-dependent receptor plug domain-containing protein [Prevotellaceae bacterium]
MKNLGTTIFVALLFISAAQVAAGEALLDTIVDNVAKQTIAYPQEKIYAQVDKPCYVTGEDVWFRIYLTDAMSHKPDATSRYVYAELIDPVDSVVCRVKIRPLSGAYHGHITLPKELPEGSYLLRFYTRFMEGLGDSYFFKRQIAVKRPYASACRVNASFEYNDGKETVGIALRFTDKENRQLVTPEKVQIINDKGKLVDVKPDDDSLFRATLKARKDSKGNALYVAYEHHGTSYGQYIPVQIPNSDYDVSFFPEGGNLPALAASNVAFKALNADGLGEDVTGVVVSEKGDTVVSFRSRHLGMGAFMMYPQAEEKYYAICRNAKGVEKRFALPQASPKLISLKTKWVKERLYITLTGLPDAPLYVIVHCRGNIGYVNRWDNSKASIIMNKKDLPSGVIQILLADANLTPISERLVFNINEADLAQAAFAADRPAYGSRDHIAATVELTDADRKPLQGSFSVSVTDDRDVQPDTCVNILSSMLLTSDLRGHVEAPAYYFRNRNAKTAHNLDMLMMTQGWRRYNAENMLKGKPDKPKGYIELGSVVSGTVRGGLMMTKAAADYPVTILSLRNSLFLQEITNSKGRFVFNMPEMPDSVQYVVQGNTKKGGSRVELILDPEEFPQVPISPPYLRAAGAEPGEGYLKKANQRYTIENGMRMVNLEGVEVRAARVEKKGKSIYSSPFNDRISADEIEEMRAHDVLSILRRVAGVSVFGDKISIRGASGTPLIYVDEVEIDEETLKGMPVEEVDEVEVVKSAQAAIFGSRGGNGVILITTKSGFDQKYIRSEKFNIKTIMPLGYQEPKEFYAPRYETNLQKNNNTPDLRTTVYWNPNVMTSAEGKAEVDFYAADLPKSYAVVVEGVTSDGRLVYAVEKIYGK